MKNLVLGPLQFNIESVTIIDNRW